MHRGACGRSPGRRCRRTPRGRCDARRRAPIEYAGGEMAIERGQYDAPAEVAGTDDERQRAARSADGGGALARATDIYLAAGCGPARAHRRRAHGGGDRGVIDGDVLSRELGIVAPPEARAAWTERRSAMFAYGDGAGRVRVTLTRDHRGPGAALRLLPASRRALERSGSAREVARGSSETRARRDRGRVGCRQDHDPRGARARARRAQRQRRDRSRIRSRSSQTGPVDQPARGRRARAAVSAGVAAAMREGADAIVIGSITSADAAGAVVDAVAAGHLVAGDRRTRRRGDRLGARSSTSLATPRACRRPRRCATARLLGTITSRA